MKKIKRKEFILRFETDVNAIRKFTIYSESFEKAVGLLKRLFPSAHNIEQVNTPL